MKLLLDLSPLDDAIIELVTRFGMVRTSHVRRLFFEGRGLTPDSARVLSARKLARLHTFGELHRTGHGIGGSNSGSSEFVYLMGDSRSSAATARHTLDITELYVQLVEAKRAGRIDDFEFLPEDEGYRRYGNTTVTPDALVKLKQGGTWIYYWIEVDRGHKRAGEGRTQLKGKMNKYLLADRQNVAADGLFPTVLFTVLNDERKKFISDVAKSTTDPSLFEIVLYENAVEYLLGS